MCEAESDDIIDFDAIRTERVIQNNNNYYTQYRVQSTVRK